MLCHEWWITLPNLFHMCIFFDHMSVFTPNAGAKVMFSVVSVFQSVPKLGDPMWPPLGPVNMFTLGFPWPYRGPNHTGTTFKLVQLGPRSTALCSQPRYVQTCSLCSPDCWQWGGLHTTEMPCLFQAFTFFATHYMQLTNLDTLYPNVEK